MSIDENEAAEVARDFFEDLELTLSDFKETVNLESNGEQVMYLQKNGGLSSYASMIQKQIPLYYWEVIWSTEGDYHLEIGADDEIRIPDRAVSLRARIDNDGDLFYFDYSIAVEDTADSVQLSRDQARDLARTFLTETMEIDLSRYDVVDEPKVQHKGSTDWDFQWRREETSVGDEHLEVGVAIRKDKVVTFE